MNKAQRQAAVMDLLSAMYPVALTAQQMADHLEFSVRTLERDLAELQARGLAITSTRGRRGGYIYGDSDSVLVLLTRDEAKALARGFTESSATGYIVDFRNAVEKIKNAM